MSMDDREVEELVRLVMREVLKTEAQKARNIGKANTDGYRKILVLGDEEAALPEKLKENTVCFGLEDYRRNRNILRYDLLVITRLEIGQLADLALVRPHDELTEAVVEAVLNGIETLVLPEAMAHRKYSGRGNAEMFKQLEQYAHTLERYGIRRYEPIRLKQELPAKPAQFMAPQQTTPKGSGTPNNARLITETDAQRLIAAGTPVRLCSGAILTPLAKDCFARAGVEVVYN